MTNATRAPIHAYFVLLMGIVAASVAATLIRFAQGESIPSLVIAGGRLSIATLILTPALLRQPAHIEQIRDLSMQDRLWTIVSGVFLAVHFASWVTSLEYASVLISLVLVSTSPIWVALLEIAFLKVRLSRLILLGLGLAMLGGMVIGLSGGEAGGSSSEQITGGVLSTIGAISVAVYLVIGRRIRAQLDLTPYVWMVYGTAAILLVVAVLLSGETMFGHSVAGYGWIVLLALVPQLIGHSSFNYALAFLPATFVSVAGQMEPVFGSVVALIVLSEIPTVAQILGGVMIVVGVIMASLNHTRD